MERLGEARDDACGTLEGAVGDADLGQALDDPTRGEGVTEALGADPHERGAYVDELAGVSGALHAAHADHGDRDASRDGGHLGERDGPDSRAGGAPRATPEPRPPAARRQRRRTQRVDQRDGIRASVLGRLRTGGDVGCIRGQLYDQRLSGAIAGGAQPLRQHVGIGADVKPRVHVGAGDVQLYRGDLDAGVARLDQPRELLGGRAHDVGDQRYRRSRRAVDALAEADAELAEPWQVLLEIALEALVRQPDRVDEPGGGLPQPWRRVAGARLQGDRL